MARAMGLPKTGGRKKGTPNKLSLRLHDLLESCDLNPIVQISKLLPKLSAKEQTDVMLQLLPYIYPRRKTMDLGLADQDRQPQSFTELVKMISDGANASPN